MLVTLIIILVLIGAAVVGSIYSNFMVFYSNFSESENYHKAYYASISAIERGELVTKQRSAGYTGYAGRYRNKTSESNQSTGSYSNGAPDGVISSNFSYLSNGEPSQIVRYVDSRTTKIPKTTGNVEFTLRSNDSASYNAMDYENAEVFLLYYDAAGNSPYNKTDCSIGSAGCNNSKKTNFIITGSIRLPKHLIESGNFTDLDTTSPLIGKYDEMPGNDAIIDRQIRGIYNNGTVDRPFTIFSTQKYNSGRKIDYTNDSLFRESDLNASNHTLNFNFGNSRSPFTSSHGGHSTSSIPATIISQEENFLKNKTFSRIFSNNHTSKNQIRFNLLNLVKDANGKIYPFVEYKINFGTSVADKYYTIKGEGGFSDFQVNTIIQKPTVKESVLGDFTSIF